MKKPLNYYFFLGSVFLLLFSGIIILASVSSPVSLKEFDTPYYFLKRQLLFGLLPGGALAFFISQKKDSVGLLKKWALVLLGINLILMFLVFLPGIGKASGGAARWLNLGPLSFQSAGFLKLTFIIYLASWLASKTEKISQKAGKKDIGWTFFAFAAIIGLIGLLLMFQPDISTLVIVVLSAVLMYFSAGTPFRHSAAAAVAGAAALAFLIKFTPYRLNRLLVFLNPDLDPLGKGYQIKQALLAVGSGGVAGVGLGMSNQKFGFLPQSMSDSIFAVFAEETGFLGAAFLIFLFLLFSWAGFRIIKGGQDKFSQLLAMGITSWIVLQGFINIGSIIGILPITGVPLPFISHGGTALITELVGVGILLNIAKKT